MCILPVSFVFIWLHFGVCEVQTDDILYSSWWNYYSFLKVQEYLVTPFFQTLASYFKDELKIYEFYQCYCIFSYQIHSFSFHSILMCRT